MRWFGIVFVVCSAGSVGFQLARMLRKRCELFRQLLSLLQLLRNEIAVCATPLPQCFALLAAFGKGEAAQVFATAAREMDQNCWTTPYSAMERALEQAEDPALAELLLPLAKQLGRYDVAAQLLGIDHAVQQIQLLLLSLEEEGKIKSRTYRTLGICMGLAMAILLM